MNQLRWAMNAIGYDLLEDDVKWKIRSYVGSILYPGLRLMSSAKLARNQIEQAFRWGEYL